MAQISAGLLMCRLHNDILEFFLVHPGGPFFRKKDNGFWTIPKGLLSENEEPLAAAIREFTEETGITPMGDFFSIGSTKLKSGKVVHAWAFLGDWEKSTGIVSNNFSLEWPPRSKKFILVPEADQADWFDFDQASIKINAAQKIFLSRASEVFKITQ